VSLACGGERTSNEGAPLPDAGAATDGSPDAGTIDVPGTSCLDPARLQPGYRDADHDGWTVGSVECFESLPDDYRRLPSLWEDCDDSDPEVNRVAFADQDGDGYGAAGSGTVCAPATEAGRPPPDGFGWSSIDCDDSDAETHPQAIEGWRDGRDSDCNGLDDPLRCGTGLPNSCGCELLEISSVEIDESCAGVDLFVAAALGCDCSDSSRWVVGNRGSSPAVAGFTLEFELEPGSPDEYPRSWEFHDALPAGAVTLPILVNGASAVRIVVDELECEVDNNTQELEGGACAP
jgi:hypothetical protein